MTQVDKYSMRDIYREVQNFVTEFRQTLADKTQDEINKQRDARISMQKIEIENSNYLNGQNFSDLEKT